MTSILVTIGLWIVKIVTGPAVQAILKSILDKFIQQGKDLVPVVKAAIEEAQTHTELSGTEKLKRAVATIASQFPAMETAALYSVVTAIFEQLYTVPPKTP